MFIYVFKLIVENGFYFSKGWMHSHTSWNSGFQNEFPGFVGSLGCASGLLQQWGENCGGGMSGISYGFSTPISIWVGATL